MTVFAQAVNPPYTKNNPPQDPILAIEVGKKTVHPALTLIDGLEIPQKSNCPSFWKTGNLFISFTVI